MGTRIFSDEAVHCDWQHAFGLGVRASCGTGSPKACAESLPS